MKVKLSKQILVAACSLCTAAAMAATTVMPVFADAGDAVRNLSDFDVKKGAGFGVRWDSPVGPVKLDLAWPFGDKTESGVHFYVGLGTQW